MNILYFTLDDFESLMNYRSINTDLLREFQKHGHNVYAVSPSERKKGFATRVINENNAVVLKPRIGNIQKTNIIEKGISTVTVGTVLINAIKKYYADVKFDLILYCTPPITFLDAIEYVKKRDRAKTYLLLKDIFPQNAVDIGMLSTDGFKGLLYKHFRLQEKQLYAISDRIGCMSQANVDYILKYNSDLKERNDENQRKTKKPIVEICPNSIEIMDKSVDEKTREIIRYKYGIPPDKTVFIYGGNLGKPQGIPFMIECIKRSENLENFFFLIVGDGTEAHLVLEFIDNEKPGNCKYLSRLPKEDYDNMVGACDVGLIFLDHRFTIPNFPSRMLSYMQAKIPVLACTDPNTDIGKTITEGEYGWWCESDNSGNFTDLISTLSDISEKGKKGYLFLQQNYSVKHGYEIICGDLG